MYKECAILSEPIKFPNNIYTQHMEDILYNIFKTELYNSSFSYESKPVQYRREPLYHGKEESFFHIISGKNNPMIHEYQQDIQRAARIRWGKEIILNAPCSNLSCNDNCILIWKSNKRTKLFHKKYNYLVILEEREKYWLYVTSYRIGNSERKRDLIREYNTYKNR